MKGVTSDRVTRVGWSSQGADSLRVGEVVPQLVGPLRGTNKSPVGTEFNTGTERHRHPSAQDVAALSRDMGIALIYDKSCRLDRVQRRRGSSGSSAEPPSSSPDIIYT